MTRNSLSFCDAYWPDSEEFCFLFNWANLRNDTIFKEIQEKYKSIESQEFEMQPAVEKLAAVTLDYPDYWLKAIGYGPFDVGVIGRAHIRG